MLPRSRRPGEVSPNRVSREFQDGTSRDHADYVATWDAANVASCKRMRRPNSGEAAGVRLGDRHVAIVISSVDIN